MAVQWLASEQQQGGHGQVLAEGNRAWCVARKCRGAGDARTMFPVWSMTLRSLWRAPWRWRWINNMRPNRYRTSASLRSTCGTPDWS